MTPLKVRALVVLLGAGWLGGAARAQEPDPIRDEAGLFKAETIARALPEIEKIRETFHRDFVIWTIKELPPEQRKALRFLPNRQINRRRAEEAREQAEAAGVNGIFLEICMDPRFVQVVVWPLSQERVFTASDGEAVRRKVASRLSEGNPDAALLEVIGQVHKILAENMADVPTVPTNLLFLGGILVGLLLAWVLLLGVRRGMAATGLTPPALAAAQWYTRLGTPAGAWLADKVFLAQGTPALHVAPGIAETPVQAPVDEPAPVASVPQESHPL